MNKRKKLEVLRKLLFSGKIIPFLILKLNITILKILGKKQYRYRINNFSLIFPIDHLLPFYRILFPKYSENLGLLIKAICLYQHDPFYVDIGANVGDSYAICAKYGKFNTLLIEGDPYYLQFLKANLPHTSNVRMESSFVGDHRKKARLNLHRVGGTSRLESDKNIESNTYINTYPLSSVLKKYKIKQPTLIKSDTDGFDFKILTPYLKTTKTLPILFLEFDPEKFNISPKETEKFIELLNLKGYMSIFTFNNYGDFIKAYDKRDFSKIISDYMLMRTHKEGEYYDLAVFPPRYGAVAKTYHNYFKL